MYAGLDDLKTASKKVVHKAAEAGGEFLGNKIADVEEDVLVKQEPVGEIIIPPEKRKKN